MRRIAAPETVMVVQTLAATRVEIPAVIPEAVATTAMTTKL
jgi:hypothetical protein